MAISREKPSKRRSSKQKDDFLEKIYNISDDLICIAGVDGFFKKVNPAFEKHLGYTSEELLNKPFLSFVHPDDVDITTEIVGRKFTNGLPVYNFENRYRCKNGRYKHISWTGNPIPEERIIYGIGKDITERKEAEEKIKDSEKRYRQLFDMESDAIFLIDIETGRFLQVNESASHLFGYTRDELLTKRHIDLSAEPEETLRTVANAPRTIPLRYLRKKDGTVFPAEISCNQILYDERQVLLCAVRDITERKKVEEAWKKSENRYRTLFSEMQNGFSLNEIICDEKGNPVDYVTLEVNRAFESLLGFPKEAVINKNVSSFMSKTELDHWLGIFGPVALTGKSTSYQMYSPVNNKHFRGICYSSEKGKFAVVFEDVTEQKAAEVKMRELAKRHAQAAKEWQQTFDCASDIICMVSRDFEFLRINKRGLDDLGKPPEEIIGKKCYELVHGLEHPIEGCPCLKTLKTKQSGHGDVYDHGLYFRTSASPIFDGDGNLTAFVHTISDITEQKRAEVALKEAHKDLEDAQRIAKIGSWKWTTADSKVNWSEGLCSILGWDPQKTPPPFEQMAGFYSPESWKRLNEAVAKALRTGEPYDIETTEIRTDGTMIMTNTRGEADYRPDGKIIGLHGTVQDITERKQMQQQLFMQDRLASIGQLVAGVAHELNNPLTSVIGFSELLLERQLPADIGEDIKIIHSEARRTMKIVKNLLTFARQQPQEKQLVVLSEPIQTVLRVRAHEHAVNNINVITQFAPDLPPVMANISQMQQVFFNILTNAEFAMLEANHRGNFVIKTERKGAFVKASFADDGPGICREHMDHLFRPFFTTKEVGKGTGLGLSICQGIVTEHGGTIRAESNPGLGATFIIELPVYQPGKI